MTYIHEERYCAMAGDWRYAISYVYVHLSSLSRVFFGPLVCACLLRCFVLEKIPDEASCEATVYGQFTHNSYEGKIYSGLG